MHNPFSLQDKWIIVTGASTGIGAETAIILSQSGANVVLVGRNEDRLNITLNKMDNTSAHRVEVFDLNDIDSIPSWLKKVAARIESPIHGLAHFAGIHQTIPLRVLNRKNMDEIMNTNVYSALSFLRGFSNKTLAAPGCSIVLASSVVGEVGQSGVVSYSASKGAINAIVKSAALELARYKVRVNAVAPGLVKTEMFNELFKIAPSEQYEKSLSYHPLGFGEPEDVAYATQFLLSNASKWVTGSILSVDGGYTCH